MASLKLHATDVIIPSKIEIGTRQALINNTNLQGTQYNKKKVKELVSYGKAIA